MKNNKTFSLFLWLFVAFLSVVYFMTQDKTREIEAISETNSVTEKASKQLLEETEFEMEKWIIDTGLNPRDLAVLKKLKNNNSFLNSTNTYENLEWQKLESTIPTIHQWVKMPSKSALYHTDYSSEKITTIHQNLLYKLYQTFLIAERSKISEYHHGIYRTVSLGSLDSTIYIYNWEYQILPQISVSPNLEQLKSYSTSFDFTKSDTVVFQVVTEFYNKQREKEIRLYRVIAKDKKGAKISSPLDYEEIE